MATEILIDPNVRVANNETFSGFEDVIGDLPDVGAVVLVREPESNIAGQGRVTRVDNDNRLVYLAVDWANLQPPAATPSELLSRLAVSISGRLWASSTDVGADSMSSMVTTSSRPTTRWLSHDYASAS